MPETQPKSVPEVAGELFELTKAYARQETVDPLKGVGRYLIFGGIGAFIVAIGVVLLMLAGLRALQTETGKTFAGSLSFLPYVIVLAVATLVIAVALSRIPRKKQ